MRCHSDQFLFTRHRPDTHIITYNWKASTQDESVKPAKESRIADNITHRYVNYVGHCHSTLSCFVICPQIYPPRHIIFIILECHLLFRYENLTAEFSNVKFGGSVGKGLEYGQGLG